MNDTEYPLLATKLHIPTPRPERVSRTGLVERLDKGMRGRLTLVSAPAGFGKTTLLSEWLGKSRCPSAWISLDNRDNDPVRFLQYIIAAIKRIEPGFGEATANLLKFPQQPALEVITINLIREIETISKDFVLILDDYHCIETPQIHQIVELIVERMPPQMHLGIATRADPGLPLARLRVRDQLNELRVVDLSFTRNESAAFLNQVMKFGLTDQEIDMLERRTEGWIAGLQLAALSMQGRSDIPGFINTFAGDDRLIVDYLVEEVINRQTPEVQHFLLQTSILPQLSEPLCDHVTNQSGSQKMLEKLERGNLFLIPLDNKRGWYRYHHLFADLLEQRMFSKNPQAIGPLHAKACEWFEANGFIEDAIEHALCANEFERTANLIEVFIEEKWRGDEQIRLFNWLDRLPDEFKLRKPNLGICHARFLFESGHQEAAEKRLDRIEKTVARMPAGELRRLNKKPWATKGSAQTALHGRTAAIKAYIATRRGDIPGIAAYSQHALDGLSQNDHAWRTIVEISSAIAHQIKGDMRAAIDALNDAVSAARSAGNLYFDLTTRIWLAIVLKLAGRLPESLKIARQLVDEVDAGKLSFSAAPGHAWGTWGEMRYELNELEEAHRFSQKGVDLLEQSHDVSYLGWRYACLAKIRCSMLNLKAATEIVPKMDDLVENSVVPPWILTQIKSVKARIYLMRGDHQALEDWVRECGLRLDGEISILNEAEYAMFARTLVARGRFEEALGLLSRLNAVAQKAGRIFHRIEALVLQGLVFSQRGAVDDSRSAVKKALELAEPGGYVRIFTDEGPPMAELLKQMLDDRADIPRAFVQKLLPAFQSRQIVKNDNGLVESLSERELEVLRLTAAGLSNKKTSEQLFVSVSTVKTHLRHVYAKLDVHSRTEAIVKAREIGLL